MTVTDLVDEFGMWLRRKLEQLQVTQSPATGAGSPPVQPSVSTATDQPAQVDQVVAPEAPTSAPSTTNTQEATVPVADEPAPAGATVEVTDADSQGFVKTETTEAAPSAAQTGDVAALQQAVAELQAQLAKVTGGGAA